MPALVPVLPALLVLPGRRFRLCLRLRRDGAFERQGCGERGPVRRLHRYVAGTLRADLRTVALEGHEAGRRFGERPREAPRIAGLRSGLLRPRSRRVRYGLEEAP